ncbi:MAG: hypothetical protein J5815_01820 [Clostridia bacterium]|nr:hypothetical protein [Clostridia bacterium]
MLTKKEIFVLSGSGHKGSVKISPIDGSKNKVRIECNLDFRPNNATLYVIGDEIAKTPLNDSKTTTELPFLSNSVQGCVVRSSAQTMFGGRGDKAEMLAKINVENGQKSAQKPKQNTVDFKQKSFDAVNKNNVQKDDDIGQKSESSSLAKLLSATSNDAGILKYNGSNFYLAIKPQLDEMFVCYKQENALNKAVENSSWVHIDTEDGYYVVGLLKNNDTPAYICYGVPSKDGNDVPPELKNVCVWLPVEDENVKGYWVIYQSAVDGDIVK